MRENGTRLENREEIRWKQRFQNFEKALALFGEAVLEIDNLGQLEKEGLVQRFEYTFELAWKTIKDYLQSVGVGVKFPRETIKQAFHYGVIQNGEIWFEMLEKRNQMAHMYDEEHFNEVIESIENKYYSEIRDLNTFFAKKLNE